MGQTMVLIKYKGGLGESYRTTTYEIAKGMTQEVMQEEASRLLADFPGCFEVIGNRSLETTPHDRMKREPAQKRGKT